MADPVIINPTLTLAGQAAAFNASNDGLELKITHVSFGTAHYDPTGEEVGLRAPVGNKVAVAGASRPTPYQIRMVSSWREDVGQVAIGEIAFWAGATLAFVWSKADGTIASYKTDGVSYVLFNDLAFSSVPANSISFVVDPNESVALAALAAHEGANNAHPQYVLRAKFPDYQGHLWGAATGGVNAVELKLPAIVELTNYTLGNRFTFKALYTNTGPMTINVNEVGPVEVLKTGGLSLTAGSVIAGGVYDVYYDGSNFQLTAGAGFASAEATEEEVRTAAGDKSTSWVSARRLRLATKDYLPLTGGTLSGALNFDAARSIYIKPSPGESWAAGLILGAFAAEKAGIGFYGSKNEVSSLFMRIGPTPWANGYGLKVSALGVEVTGPLSGDGSGLTNLKYSSITGTPNSLAGLGITFASQSEAETGADTNKPMSALRVFQAIAAKVVQATDSVMGLARVASQLMVNAGTDDATFVTPKKLRFGFQIFVGPTGYIVFPTWLGGWIVQWSGGVSLTGSVINTTYFPIPFPNSIGAVIVGSYNNTNANDYHVRLSDGESGRGGTVTETFFKTHNNGITGSAGLSYIAVGK